METKRCSKCKEHKTKDQFYKAGSQGDGLTRYCKVCKSEYIKRLRKEGRLKANGYIKKSIIPLTEFEILSKKLDRIIDLLMRDRVA